MRFFKKYSSFDHYSDDELICIYRQCGNKECIGTLFTRYTHLVFGICIKYFRNTGEAEDVTMEIFEELFEKLSVHEVENFKNWLYSVTRNKCLMVIRKNKSITEKKPKIYSNYYEEIVENSFEIHHNNSEEREIIKNRLEEALQLLKHEQQYCVRLMYIENRSYKEISDITGYNVKQVKSYIQNGKRKLKIFLDNQ